MKDIRLINILKTFSKEEMKLFGKFAASPYHNSGKNCMPLFKLLSKSHPAFETGGFTYETIHKKLYPGRKFNKQVTWNLTSAMEKMAKEFLKLEALKKNDFVQMDLALTEFGSRKLLNNYSNTLREMENLLDKSSIDFEYFSKQYKFKIFKQTYYFSVDKVQLIGDSTIKTAEWAAIYFLRIIVGALKDMQILQEYYNYKVDINVPLSIVKNLDLKRIVDYVNREGFEFAFHIEIYYHSLMMLLEPDETWHLDKYRELFEKHFKKFNKIEQTSMIHDMVNYCMYNPDLGNDKFKRIIFELNEFKLKEGLAFYPDKQLSKTNYLQILNSALAVNETEWAENYIKEYAPKLLPDIRESMKYMANAFLCFHTKEYRKVLENVNKVEFVDIRDKIHTRALSAKSYYELNETETLLHYIDSSKHFIINNPSVSDIERIHIHNFFKYLTKLVFLKESGDTVEINILRNDIEKNKEIANKEWLLKKLSELEISK